MAVDEPLTEALRCVATALDSLATASMIIGGIAVEEEALARATVIHLSGQQVRVAIPEDLVVYEAAAWRDRDKSDIERLCRSI